MPIVKEEGPRPGGYTKGNYTAKRFGSNRHPEYKVLNMATQQYTDTVYRDWVEVCSAVNRLHSVNPPEVSTFVPSDSPEKSMDFAPVNVKKGDPF